MNGEGEKKFVSYWVALCCHPIIEEGGLYSAGIRLPSLLSTIPVETGHSRHLTQKGLF